MNFLRKNTCARKGLGYIFLKERPQDEKIPFLDLVWEDIYLVFLLLKSELLARHLGISKGRISQIESGHCKELTIIRINKIAEFLDVNFFEVVSNKNKIGNNEFGADHPGHQHHVSSESKKKIVDELVNRMMR